MNKKNQILTKLKEINDIDGAVNARQLADIMKLDRTTISRYLNELVREELVEKTDGRPVFYNVVLSSNEKGLDGFTKSSDDTKIGANTYLRKETKYKIENTSNGFVSLIGHDKSLYKAIQKAKAAIVYPPNGLHTLILGDTGVGKSFFAKKMHEFSVKENIKSKTSPFTVLNCADFSDNPQLLLSQIFGSKKGAYTGADKDRDGLLKVSNGGILFLDEVHRLPPQGQEMLFTYIDNGVFRELGSMENVEGVNVQIIAATTEKPDSYLLDTFRRRIPMVIELPSLSDRSIAERYQLIANFISAESRRISKSIHFSRNTLISFMLYECKNNIGQLKSDIQLAIAKGFLSYITNNENYIKVRSKDIPEVVRRGFFKYKENRVDIDKLLPNAKDLFKFHYEEINEIDSEKDYVDGFYNNVDKKIASLKSDGIDENEIREILNNDLEEYFNSLLSGVNKPQVLNNLEQLVGSQVIGITNEMLNISSQRLEKKYSKEIFAALSLHIKGAIERIESGLSVVNPKLNQIRINYSKEFITAMECARLIENEFNIILPIDEIGYLTMFLINDYESHGDIASSENVIVITIMHGNSTATSMTDVVNELIGKNYAVGFDMPLSKSVDEMYSLVRNYVLTSDHSKGVLLMVDMGSLSNFADMLFEEHGIICKTIDMTSTALLLDATRKAIMGQELNEIVNSIKSISPIKESSRKITKSKKLMILTACFTGEGAAERLKRILEEKLNFIEYVEIKSVNILNRQEFLVAVDHYKEGYNLIAVVSTIKVDLDNTPVFNALDILDNKSIDILNDIIAKEKVYVDISQSIKDNISVDNEKLIFDIRKFIYNVEHNLKFQIHSDSSIGLILHIAFMIDTLRTTGKSKVFPNLKEFSSKYGYEMDIIKTWASNLDREYNIDISDDEIAYITKVVINNKVLNK